MRRSKQLLAFLALALCALSFGVVSATADAPQATAPQVSEVSYATAHVKAELDPKGESTSWVFEVSTDGTNWERTNVEGGAEGTGLQPVHGDITSLNFGNSSLKPGTTYQVRLSASNGSGSVTSPEPNPEFTTKSLPAPSVAINPVTTFTGTTATFSGTINPNAPAGNPSVADVNWRFQCNPECPNVNIGSSPTPNPIPADAANHTVSAAVTGLEPNTTYHVTLVGENAGDPVEAGPVTFTTGAVAPQAETIPAFALEGGTEAMVGGWINPKNSATTYRIDYGTTTAYGKSAPASQDASAGSAGAGQVFSQTIAGLTPSTVYHFRVVAENASGEEATGADKTFETAPAGPASEPSCPNAALRTENNSNALPDCRAYEQVSPVDKNGFDAGANGELQYEESVAAEEGSALAFVSFGSFADPQAASLLNEYISRRDAGGWTTHALVPLQSRSGGTANPVFQWFSPDLRFAMLDGGNQGHLAPGDNPNINNLYLRDNLTNTYQTLNLGGTAANSYTLGGGSTDGKHMVFEAWDALTPDAPSANPGEVPIRNVYEWNEGQVKLASIRLNSAGEEEPAPAGAILPVNTESHHNEVSRDGSRLVFRDIETAQLYLREDGQRTLLISESQRAVPDTPSPPYFAGASADLSRIFFTSAEALTEGSVPGRSTVYMYDVDTETVTDLTADALPGGVGGASVAAVSDSGEYVYFATDLRFHAGDNEPGGSGLYVWHNGIIKMIATSTENTEGLYTHYRVSPDGRRLSFDSTTQLTAYDNTDTVPDEGGAPREDREVYVYDAAADRLTCVSCNPSGQRPTGAPNGGPPGDSFVPGPPKWQFANLQPGVGDDGHVFFTSRDALVPQDVNGKLDVYEWRDGRVHLISAGTGGGNSFLASSSGDGKDVFFQTRDRLVAADRDDSEDLYDARVGGGFPRALEGSRCEGIEGCHDAAGANPSFDNPASGSFSSSLKQPDPRASRLRKALKACKHKKKKKAKAKCRATAKKRYGKASKGRTH